MARNRPGDEEPLLRPAAPTPPRTYGSVGGLNDTNNDERGNDNDDDNDNDRAEQRSVPASERSTSTVESKGCLAAVLSRDSYHQRLLVFNVLAILLGIVTAGIIFLELSRDLGQCIIGMPLYEGGLLARGVRRFWCRCPLYTVMLCSTIPWISIMVNWVSDLFSKKCAYGKWLKWQMILTCGGTIAAMCAGCTSAFGFGNWCTRVIKSLDIEDLYHNSVTASSQVKRECYSAALMFDKRFDDEFVKLKDTFWFSLGITILQILLIFCWVGCCYYSVRMWTRLPKETFFAQMLLPPGLQPRGHISRRADDQEQDQEQLLAPENVGDPAIVPADNLEHHEGVGNHLHEA